MKCSKIMLEIDAILNLLLKLLSTQYVQAAKSAPTLFILDCSAQTVG